MWVRGHSRSLKVVSFESLGAVSYSPSAVTMAVSVAVCEIFSVKEWCDLENRVRVRSMSLNVYLDCAAWFEWFWFIALLDMCRHVLSDLLQLQCITYSNRYIFFLPSPHFGRLLVIGSQGSAHTQTPRWVNRAHIFARGRIVRPKGSKGRGHLVARQKWHGTVVRLGLYLLL